jgi:hypothetical protein
LISTSGIGSCAASSNGGISGTAAPSAASSPRACSSPRWYANSGPSHHAFR